MRSAFSYCENLKSLKLAKGPDYIGNYAFYRCQSLGNVEIPENTTHIGENAFQYCFNLESITLPESLTSLGASSFDNCTSLMSVSCKWESLADVSADESAFNGIPAEATLYVPTGTKSIYQAKAPWNGFSNISEKDFGVGIYDVEAGKGVTITADGGVITVSGADVSRVEVYTADGLCVYSGTGNTISNLAHGIYIVKAAGQTKKITL